MPAILGCSCQLSEQIISNLQSTTTTDTGTVENLCSLLGSKVNSATAKIQPNAYQTGSKNCSFQNKVKEGTVKSAKTPRLEKSTSLQIHENLSCKNESLSSNEKRILATEVFNRSLKCLSNAVKEKLKSDNKQTARKTPSKARALPLQESSPNKQTKSTNSNYTSEANIEDAAAVADCAIIALDCLRQLQPEAEKVIPSHESRFEKGATILTEKLITLRLPQKATSEIVKIYEQYWKRRKDIQQINLAEIENLERCIQASACILGPTKFYEKPDFDFVCSYQSQVLRLVILLGSQAVTEKFLTDVGLMNNGSPAETILNGLDAGFIDGEKAGEQLRTIAQALLKLYAVSASGGSTRNEKSTLYWNLLVEALIIKCRSWKLLQHKADPDREVWAHFLKGLRRFETGCISLETQEVRNAISALRKVNLALRENGFDPITPTTVMHMILDIAEKSSNFKEGLVLLAEQNEMSKSWSIQEQAVLHWRAAVMLYKTTDNKDQQLLAVLKQVLRSFTAFEAPITQHMENTILHGARLRKTVIAIACNIGQKATQIPCTDIEIEVAKLCLQILSRFSEMCLRLLGSTDIEKEIENWKLIFTSFARTYEGVLDTTQHFAKLTLSVKLCGDARLAECAGHAHQAMRRIPFDSRESEVVTFLQGLLVQTSNVYWTEYAQSDVQDAVAENSIKLLERSCSVLMSVSPNIQRSGSYGMKLEKLALAWLARNDISSACQSFEDAIDFYTTIGGLEEAVKSTCSDPSHLAWSRKGTCSYSLGKALQSLTKLRLAYEENRMSTSTWIYDNSECSVIQRSLLFEVQVAAIGTHAFSAEQVQSFQEHIYTILNLDWQPDFFTYRLRFLSGLFHTISKNVSLSNMINLQSPNLNEVINGSLCAGSAAATSILEGSIRPLAQLQWLMLSNDVEAERLQTHVDTLSSFVLAIQDTDILQTSIDNTNILLNLMQAIIDFGRTLDNIEIMIPCLLSVKHILTLTASKPVSRVIEVLTQLGSVYHRLGKILEAGKTFVAAEQLLQEDPKSLTARMRWTSSYADYLLDTAEPEKAIAVYKSLAHYEISAVADGCSGNERLSRELELSRLAQVASRLVLHSGNAETAVRFARQAVRLSTQCWQCIEKSQSQAHTTSNCGNDSLQTITTDLSTMSLSSDRLSQRYIPRGNVYWNCVDIYVMSLRQMISISMQNGMYQDAKHYSEQFRKVALAVGSDRQILRASALSALIHAKAGNATESSSSLKACQQLITAMPCLEDRLYLLNWAEALVEIGDLTSATAILDSPFPSSAQSTETDSSIRPPKTGIHKQPVRGRAKSVKSTKAPPKRPGRKTPTAVIAGVSIAPKPHAVLSQQFVFEKRQALRNQIKLLDTHKAASAPEDIRDLRLTSNATDVAVTTAMLMLRQALVELSSDAVKCVLSETAVALPVRYRSSRKSGRISFLNPTDLPVVAKTGRGTGTLSKNRFSKRQTSSGEKLILEAQKLLNDYGNIQNHLCASEMLHTANKIESKLALLSTTIGAPSALTSSSLAVKSLASKDAVLDRERDMIRAECITRDRAQISQWPDVGSLSTTKVVSTILDYSIHDLTDIPETWSIVTISLADDRQELLMSKIVAGRSPFLLRIPLSRSDMDIDEDTEFSFEEAKAELADIVTKANASTHDSRGQGDRDTRKAWYAERESLDEQLEGWLRNVENIWLGGFRGLLSPITLTDELLDKFGHKFNSILDKHLPSRQKSAGSVKNKVALHSHVFELFLGLGDPEDQELDDAIIDLLYFVVDILQFSGEHNAYDEIDFDAMLVDVLDAIRYCHDSAVLDKCITRHTILVIDKEMASFPWESLPCLQGQSVSRMPSLGSIFERLKKIREMSVEAQGHCITADQGAYILNPSSDLVSTQATFEPILHTQLPGYTSIVNRKPTESEFSSLLTTNQLLLYFGHGSGAQYIRGRTIRSLDTCAVTLLLGCSSAQMTECGKFESYGMPGYYIGGISGCMAVVGTLWDVTDRDVDRFAVKMMVEWGLVVEDERVEKALERSNKKTIKKMKKGGGRRGGDEKSKSKVRGGSESGIEGRRGLVSLDDAVARARDSCLLRYLNGAAPVVYGVPVYLK